EFQAGRVVEALRAAWRTGTRAAWRGAATVAGEAGISTPSVIALAEAIFVYTDELATGVFEGYLRMQSDEASERERRRRRLASLLLDADTHDTETIARASELARFKLPGTLAVVALPGEEPGAVARRLGVEPLDGLADGHRQRLLETLEAWLDHQRRTPRVAAQLHVHPQTVRYRLGKLRELLGEELDRADARFELELALRVRKLI